MTQRLALGLTFATGLSGLVYQVTWQRYLAILLGSHGEATAAVLGLFLGGLAGGYAIFGAVTRRRVAAAGSASPPRLLALYGAVEVAIGVWALAFPLLFAGVRALAVAVPELPPAAAFGVDVFLAALLLLPPTLLMGGTIPILTQGLARSTEDATRIHARIYGINTAGAVAGALLAGFWMVSALGFPGTLRVMAAVNLVAGLWFWRAGDAATAPPAAAESGSAEPVRGLLPFLVAALLSGFAMMTLEIVAIRIGALSLGSSEYAFAVVVAVFVGCIATGSLVVGALPRVPSALLVGSQLALVAVLVALYPRVTMAPYYAQRLRTIFTTEDVAFYPYYALVFLAALSCMAPAVLLSGATLPLIFDHLRRRYGELGAAAGKLYSWNTVGSLLGALVGGYLLLLRLDLHHVYRIAVGALVLGAALLALAQLRRGGRPVPIACSWLVLAALGVRLVTLPAWLPEDLAIGLFRMREPLEKDAATIREEFYARGGVVFYDDDPGVSVAVQDSVGTKGEPARLLKVNGKSDSATFRDTTTTISLGVIPALLAEDPRRAFIAGLGTGVTGGELAVLEGMEEVIVAEISPGVVGAAPLFDFANHDASRNPKIRIARSDAYRALQREKGRFDLIVSEPSNPWVTGVEMLYSREFLEVARSRLASGGVFCQWMHLYETDDAAVEMVLRTFASVFENVSIWYGLGADLLVLGMPEPPAPDALLERVVERAKRPDFAAALARAELASIAGLLSHERVPLGALNRVPLEGPLHTLEHPRLSHVAARAFFRGRRGELPFTGYGEAARVGRTTALLPRYLASLSGEERLEARRNAVAEACRRRADDCTTFLAAWISKDEDYEAFEEAIARAVRQRPEFGGAVGRSQVLAAARLLPGEAIPAVGRKEEEDGLPASRAQSASQVFQRFYHHAHPFEPGRLLETWEACRDTDGRCDEGRSRAGSLIATGGEG